MLSTELQKLKEKLEGKSVEINRDKLLSELRTLEIESLNESLSLSNKVCKSCGRKL
jgi:hypothetical protein